LLAYQKKRTHVAPSGETNAQHIRVFGCVYHLIRLGRFEVTFKTNRYRQRCERLRIVEGTAFAEFPAGNRDGGFTNDINVDGLMLA